MARVRSVIDTIQEHDSPERFCKLGAAVRFGSPASSTTTRFPWTEIA